MNIIVDSYLKGVVNHQLKEEFTRTLLNSWLELFPEDHLTVLGDAPASIKTAGNHTAALRSETAKSTYRDSLRYHFLLPHSLKKSGADVFLSLFGSRPVTMPMPMVSADFQILVLEWAGKESLLSATKKRFQEKPVARIFASKSVAEGEGHGKSDSANMFMTVYPGPFTGENPAGPEERGWMLDQLTAGREYFYYAGNPEQDTNFIDLLKGFAAFKKRQKTQMQLVIKGSMPQQTGLNQLISTYLFRNDLHFTGTDDIADNTKIAACAYAVWCVQSAASDTEILRMMRLAVPVISGDPEMQKYFPEGSILIATPDQPGEINRQLTSVFIDELNRSAMIRLGIDYSGRFTWYLAVQEIREILKAVISRAAIP